MRRWWLHKRRLVIGHAAAGSACFASWLTKTQHTLQSSLLAVPLQCRPGLGQHASMVAAQAETGDRARCSWLCLLRFLAHKDAAHTAELTPGCATAVPPRLGALNGRIIFSCTLHAVSRECGKAQVVLVCCGNPSIEANIPSRQARHVRGACFPAPCELQGRVITPFGALHPMSHVHGGFRQAKRDATAEQYTQAFYLQLCLRSTPPRWKLGEPLPPPPRAMVAQTMGCLRSGATAALAGVSPRSQYWALCLCLAAAQELAAPVGFRSCAAWRLMRMSCLLIASSQLRACC